MIWKYKKTDDYCQEFIKVELINEQYYWSSLKDNRRRIRIRIEALVDYYEVDISEEEAKLIMAL